MKSRKVENFPKKKAIKKILFSLALITAILVSALVYPQDAFYVYAGKSLKSLPVYRVGRDDKKISITFDCAWGTDYTDKILDALDRFKVTCTFFAVKFWVEKHPDYVTKIVERGHEIGTHSSTHPHMTKLSGKGITTELKESKEAIEKITGETVKLFRAPFGEYNNAVIDAATELGLYTIQWDVDSLDWKDLDKSAITERILKRVKSGSIILCHNNGLHTWEALPDIFSALIAEGYRFVPVSELIYTENYMIAPDGEQRLVG